MPEFTRKVCLVVAEKREGAYSALPDESKDNVFK